MQRILMIFLVAVACCLSCTNEDNKNDSTLLPPPTTGNAGDTAGRHDTASYERMPQQATDSTEK